jgi:hypothetical protein
VNGQWLRAAGAEEIVRPRRLGGASGRPLNFTVRGQRETQPGVLRRVLRRVAMRLPAHTEMGVCIYGTFGFTRMVGQISGYCVFLTIQLRHGRT